MGDYSWGGVFETAAEENQKLRSDLERVKLLARELHEALMIACVPLEALYGSAPEAGKFDELHPEVRQAVTDAVHTIRVVVARNRLPGPTEEHQWGKKS